MKEFVIRTEQAFRDALLAKGERRVTFAPTHFTEDPPLCVIQATGKDRRLTVSEGDLTIDGDGKFSVQIIGFELCFENCKNVTLRNICIRRGFHGFDKKDAVGEALIIRRAKNVLIEWCSVSWGTDETLSILDSKIVAVTGCIIGQPLDEPRDEKGKHIHPDKQHGYGMLICGSRNVFIENNYFVDCRRRTPSVSADGKYGSKVSIKNNIIFNWGEQGIIFNAGGDKRQNKTHRLCIENNLFVPGPNMNKQMGEYLINIEAPREKKQVLKLYCNGNTHLKDSISLSLTEKFDYYTVWWNHEGRNKEDRGQIRSSKKYRLPSYESHVTMYDKETVLREAGSKPRDPYDAELVQRASTAVGVDSYFINSEKETALWDRL